MSLYFGLIMFLCIVPTLFICYYQCYPKNCREKKLILGIKNREEFWEGENAKTVEHIVQKYRSQARVVVAAGTGISCVLLLLHGMALQTTVWTAFVFLAIMAVNVPYFMGNRELKDFKRRIGLGNGEKVSFVDLENAGAVHALKPIGVILPNLAGGILVLLSLLIDLKIFPVRGGWLAGSFLMTAILATGWFMGLLITAFAFLMDGFRNEAISADSAVNANYNRAKKKNMADYFVLFLWLNVAFMMLGLAAFLFFYTDLLAMIGLAVYMLLLMGGTAVFVLRQRQIERSYEKEFTILSDDDDNWILGQLYYNPRDSRLNVEKRVGVGGTINLAHPLGKVFGVLAGLSLVFTVLCLVWLGMLEATPLRLTVEQGCVICHQLRDEYVIPVSEIETVEWGEDIHALRLARISGVGMDDLLKGNFYVNDQRGCKVFLAPSAGCYVKIVTAQGTYYVSGATAQETQEAYHLLAESGKMD